MESEGKTTGSKSLLLTQEMKPKIAKRISTEVRTWYGAKGRVELHDPFWHIVGVWGLDVPHPPLVNLLIRMGLPRDAKRELSFHHEFGHLEMLPFALLETVVLHFNLGELAVLAGDACLGSGQET